MKIYSYSTMLRENGTPYLVENRAYNVDGRFRYDTPDKIADFAVNGLAMHRCAEEYVYVICLDNANHVVGCFEVSHGTANISLINPREVFQKALLIGACRIALVHNHPSGNVTPSQEDIEVTRRVKEAGEILGIDLIDHLVVGRFGEYVSFRSAGFVWERE